MGGSSLLIQGGRVVDPAHGVDDRLDVLVQGTQVEAVGKGLDRRGAEQLVAAADCLVLPGLVDTHVHLCQPFGGPQGHRMLARAGVTCALDLAGDGASLLSGIRSAGAGITVAYVFPLIPGETVADRDPGRDEIVRVRDAALAQGALGVKVLGGHFPLSAEATARTIEASAEACCWCAIHAGTMNTGSDIDGLEELIELAGGAPIHVAHVNSYCRGQRTGDPLAEASRAIAALSRAPQARSESYLALINGANATIEQGVPKSNVVKTCLELGGFSATEAGMRSAILAGWARIHGVQEQETVLLPPEAGLAHFAAQQTHVGVSFPVNPPGAAIGIALARQDGAFVVTALSTDGGAIPRNTTLEQGLALVEFGALSLADLVRKACLDPARMVGLERKGHLGPGADADIVVVDPHTRKPIWVIARGEVIMRDGDVVGRGGRIATTPAGVGYLESEGIAYDLATPAWLEQA